MQALALVVLCWPLPAAEPLPAPEPEVALSDLARFPDARTVSFWVDFNERYEKHCLDTASVQAWAHRHDWWASAAVDAERMREPWRYLSWAQMVPGAEEHDWRLYYLRQLKGEIGTLRYAAGDMPQPVPWWRWRWVEGNHNAR